MLQKAELALLEARVAYGSFEDAEATLEVEEEVVKEVKGRRAMQRLQGQTRMMVNAERSRKAQERFVVWCACWHRKIAVVQQVNWMDPGSDFPLPIPLSHIPLLISSYLPSLSTSPSSSSLTLPPSPSSSLTLSPLPLSSQPLLFPQGYTRHH